VRPLIDARSGDGFSLSRARDNAEMAAAAVFWQRQHVSVDA
jgi:hypothetical protein